MRANRVGRSLLPVSALTAALLLAGCPATGGPEPPEAPAAIREFDHWYSCFKGTQQMGWMRRQRIVTDNHVHTAVSVQMRFKRLRDITTVKLMTLITETIDGKPVRFVHEANMGGATLVAGTVEGDELDLAITGASGTKRRILPLAPEVLWPLALERRLAATGYKPGTRLALKVFLPETNPFSPTASRFVIKQPVRRTVNGRPVLLARVCRDYPAMPGIDGEDLLDENHEPVELISRNPGLNMRYVRGTRELAMRPGAADMVGAGMIVRLKKPLPPRHTILRGTYRLSTLDGRKLTDLPSDARQTVTRRSESALQIVVRRGPETAPTPATRPYRGEPDLSAFLVSSSLIDHATPEITAAARREVGPETDALAAARTLEAFVHRHIKNVNFSRAIDSAGTVMKSREGDCTEHGVLLAALCRAAGIPARCAVGLLGIELPEGRPGLFGFHMWTEVWIGDRWIGLDATEGQGRIGGTHIRTASAALSGEAGMSVYLQAFSMLGNLKIDLLDVKLDPTAPAPAATQPARGVPVP